MIGKGIGGVLIAMIVVAACAERIEPTSVATRTAIVRGLARDVVDGYPTIDSAGDTTYKPETDIIWAVAQASAWFDASGGGHGAGQTDLFGNSGSQDLQLKEFRGAVQEAATPMQTKSATGLALLGSIGRINDTTKIASIVNCGVSATAYVTGHASFIVFNKAISGLLTLREVSSPSSANGYMNPCPPPQAHFDGSGGGFTVADGGSLAASVPPGTGLSLAFETRNAQPGAGIKSYSWTVNGSSVGSASSATYVAYPGTSVVSLSVTDSAGASSATGAEIDIYTATCPDGSTPIIGPCEDTQDAGTPYSWGGGVVSEPGEDHGGPPDSVWACYVTDWYETDQYGNITYIDTTVDYCDLEQP